MQLSNKTKKLSIKNKVYMSSIKKAEEIFPFKDYASGKVNHEDILRRIEEYAGQFRDDLLASDKATSEVPCDAPVNSSNTDGQRYFIVFYAGNIRNGTVRGHMDFTTSGGYINKYLTLSQIGKRHSDKSISQVILTNIIELTKANYEQWVEEEEADNNQNNKL